MATQRVLKRFLVVGDDVRVVKTKPTKLPMNEVVYELEITFPPGWGMGQSAGKIELDIPPPPESPTITGVQKSAKPKDQVT